MCYTWPGPRCSSHALATLQSKQEAFIAAASEHISVRQEIEILLDNDLEIPPRLDQRYGDAMMKVAATRQAKEQAQAEFDATPAGQKKLQTGMEMLCSYEADEWTHEHADRLEHFMDRLEAGQALRAHRMQELRKAQGHVDLDEEDIPRPKNYGDMYFDISAARDPKPVFVYGSLMEGLHNSPLIGEDKQTLEGEVEGVALFARGTNFPYAVAVEGTDQPMRASGELVRVDDHRFAVTLFKLDQLEGYEGPEGSNHYDRVLTTVTTKDGQKTEAWMYVAAPSVGRRVANTLPLIESGSWRDHLAQSEKEVPYWMNPKFKVARETTASQGIDPSSKDLGADPPWDNE